MSTQAAPTLQALGISSPHDDALVKKKRSSRPSSRSSSRNASPTETHSKTFVSATLDQENLGVNSNNATNAWKPAPARVNHEVDTTLLKKSSSGASSSKDAAPTVSKPGSRRNSGQPRKVLGDLSQNNNNNTNSATTAAAAVPASGADFMTQAKKPKSSKSTSTVARAPFATIAVEAPKNPEPEPSGISLDETMVAAPNNEDENKAIEAAVNEKQVVSAVVVDASHQEEAPKDMTKAFKWERPMNDDDEDDEEDEEDKPKATNKAAEEFKEEELDEDELDMGVGIVTDPASHTTGAAATTTSTPPKGRVSPPCPPATVAAAANPQEQQQPGATINNHHGLDQGLESLVAAFAASNFEATSDVTASTTAQSSPSVKPESVAAAAPEAAPVPEAGNWISEELEARLKEKEIYEANVLLVLKTMGCATPHDLARYSASHFTKAGINKVTARKLESIGKPWLKPKGPSLVQQMVQLVSPSKQARTNGYRRNQCSSLDDVTQFDKDRSTNVGKMAYYEEHVRSPTVLLNARSEFEARMAKQKAQREANADANGHHSNTNNATAAKPFNITETKKQPVGGENAVSGEGEAGVRGAIFAKHLRSPNALTREAKKFAKRMEKNKGATSTDAQPFKFAAQKNRPNKAPSFSEQMMSGLNMFNGSTKASRHRGKGGDRYNLALDSVEDRNRDMKFGRERNSARLDAEREAYLARIAKEGSHTKAVAPQFVTDARFGERATSHDDANTYMAQQEEMDEMQGPKWRAKMAARADAEKMAWEARRAAGTKDGKGGLSTVPVAFHLTGQTAWAARNEQAKPATWAESVVAGVAKSWQWRKANSDALTAQKEAYAKRTHNGANNTTTAVGPELKYTQERAEKWRLQAELNGTTLEPTTNNGIGGGEERANLKYRDGEVGLAAKAEWEARRAANAAAHGGKDSQEANGGKFVTQSRAPNILPASDEWTALHRYGGADNAPKEGVAKRSALSSFMASASSAYAERLAENEAKQARETQAEEFKLAQRAYKPKAAPTVHEQGPLSYLEQQEYDANYRTRASEEHEKHANEYYKRVGGSRPASRVGSAHASPTNGSTKEQQKKKMKNGKSDSFSIMGALNSALNTLSPSKASKKGAFTYK